MQLRSIHRSTEPHHPKLDHTYDDSHGDRPDTPPLVTPAGTAGHPAPAIPRAGRRTVRSAAIGLVALALAAAGILPAATADAAPVGDLQQQAAQLEAQIQALGDRSGALDEEANGARWRLSQIQVQIKDSEARAADAEARVKTLRARISDRAAALYTNAGASTPLGALDVSSVQDLATRSTYADAAAQQDQSLITSLNNAKDDLAAQRAQLDQSQADAQAEAQRASDASRESRQVAAQLQDKLSQVKGQIAVLIKQEQERQAAAQRAALLARIQAAQAAQAAQATSGTGRTARRSGSNTTFPANLPAPSGRVAAVIAYARAQLGKPYVYLAAGPNSFDCSGLTMMAWQQAGVSLPHYSGAQYTMFPHVPLSQLQPGDLVFYGPGGSQHVQLYIGDGMVIEAPHTGDVVKISTVRRSAIGASRPG